MKNKKTIKIIASALAIASIMAMNPIGVNAEWKQDNKGWWYTEGNSWVTGWKLINGNWYYFYSDGYMAHDCWIGNYYLNEQGAWTNSAQSKLIGKWYGLYSDYNKVGEITSNTIAGIPYTVIEDDGDSLVIETNENGYKERRKFTNIEEDKATLYLYNEYRDWYSGGTPITRAK